jgi:hypothetical protein
MSRRELTMRRSPIPLVTCILLLATGLAILGIASSLPNRTESEPTVPAKANADLVRRFYIAANTFLATGNAVPLEAIVTPDLAEHPPRLGPETGRAGLVGALRSRRAHFPGLRLVLDDVRASDGARVTALVHIEDAASGSFLGLPLPPDLAEWGPLEHFRIEGDRIAERWGSGSDSARFATRWETAFDPLRPSGGDRVDLSVTRLTLAAGASWTPPPDGGTRAFFVEQGSPLAVAGSDWQPQPEAVFLTPPGRTIELNAPAEAVAPIVVLVIAVVATMPHDVTGIDASVSTPATAVPKATADVTVDVLTVARGLLIAPGVRIALGQADFASGRGLEFTMGPDAVLIAVERGAVEVTTTERNVTSQARLEAGNDVAFAEDVTGWCRAIGPTPASLLILTIVPVL